MGGLVLFFGLWSDFFFFFNEEDNEANEPYDTTITGTDWC